MGNMSEEIPNRRAEEEKFKVDVLEYLVPFISKDAKNEKEIYSLVEAGFEYVTEIEGIKIFRKRIL